MKKLKIGFGEGGFQGFMARHVEKCVLVAVILLMAWFIYSGAGKSDIKITRETLKENAQKAETTITNSRWDAIEPERTPRTNPYKIILDQKDKIDSRAYANKVWDGPLYPRLRPRQDPKIIAAEKVIATPLIGPLVLQPPESEEDTLPVDPLDKFPVVLGGMGGGAYGGSFGAAGDGDGDSGTGKPKGRKPKESNLNPMGAGGPPPGSSASGPKSKTKRGEDPYAMPTPGSAMMPGGSGTQARTIWPEALQGIKGSQGSVLQPSYAMVITAAVPYSKQWDAYREAFKDAPGGQDPVRDIPNYLQVYVARLDVTDDPSIDPATVPVEDWPTIDIRALKALENKYGAFLGELADPDAIDEKLTHPVPPFLLTDLRPVLLHPDVERAKIVATKFEDATEIESFDDGSGRFLLDDEADDGGGGSATFRGGGSATFRGGSGDTPRAMSPPRPGAGTRGAGPPPGMGGGKSRMGMGMGGNAYGGGNMDFETYRPVPKKLVRYVDFTAQPGRKYRYRVQLVLEDPNRPKDPDMDPEPTTLDEKAHERVKALEVAESKQNAETKRRKYWIVSSWSEPSDIVGMPAPERFYAGETIPSSTYPLAGASIATNEPQAKVLTVEWDPTLGVFAPAELTVYRASVLNTKADVEVIHPLVGDLRKVAGYELKTDGVVLDILGGEKLTSESKETIRAPGETLIMDAAGNLIVTDESQDIEGYRKYIFPEPKEEPKSKSDSENSMGPPMGEGGPPPGSKGGPPPGYPGGKGGKGKGAKARGMN